MIKGRRIRALNRPPPRVKVEFRPLDVAAIPAARLPPSNNQRIAELEREVRELSDLVRAIGAAAIEIAGQPDGEL